MIASVRVRVRGCLVISHSWGGVSTINSGSLHPAMMIAMTQGVGTLAMFTCACSPSVFAVRIEFGRASYAYAYLHPDVGSI